MRGQRKHDPAIMESWQGASLYSKWLSMRREGICGRAFDEFEPFYEWAIAQGFGTPPCGTLLRRYNPSAPCSPTNCYWTETTRSMKREDKARARKWDEAINRIRKNMGLPPLEGTEFT